MENKVKVLVGVAKDIEVTVTKIDRLTNKVNVIFDSPIYKRREYTYSFFDLKPIGEEMEANGDNFSLFQVAAFYPEDGKIALDPQVLTATTERAARDKTVQLLDKEVDLDKVKVVVAPLG